MAYLDGTYTTWTLDGAQIINYPFGNAPTQDAYCIAYEQPGQILAASVTNSVANRSIATNLLQRSEAFDNGYWTLDNTTVTPDIAVSPTGETTGDVLLEAAVNDVHDIGRGSVVTASAYNFSVFAKVYSGRLWLRLFFTVAAVDHDCFFNVSTGVVGNAAAGVTGAISGPYYNGWYRCSMTYTPSGAGSASIGISTDGSTISYPGSTSQGMLLWGAMLSSGSTLKAYISTTNATRQASYPDLHPTDQLAFLVEESAPSIAINYVARQTRSYTRIPKQQITYGSQVIVRPNMDDVVSGSNWFATFDDSVTSSRFTSQKTISGAPGFVSTLVNYYDVTGHGFVEGDDYVMWNANGKIVDRGKVLTVATVNRFYAYNTSLQISNPGAVNVARNAAARYVNGPVVGGVDTKLVQDFYLPGFTAGITTPTDIPLVAPALDPISWAAAIVAGTAYNPIAISNLEVWRGPIYSQTVTYAQMADALTTVSVSA